MTHNVGVSYEVMKIEVWKGWLWYLEPITRQSTVCSNDADDKCASFYKLHVGKDHDNAIKK